MATRLLHLSDLHVGAREEQGIEPGLQAIVDAAAPELIVVTGDLTHRGRPDQHERAAAFLRGLGRPVVPVPGNHDIPHTFPARFTRTVAEFERLWETAQPVHRSEGLLVVGLNSVRAWRHQSGRVPEEQLERAVKELAAAPRGALRVVALHHHLTGAPWRTRKRPVARRSHVLTTLVEAGAELILGGHTHQSTIGERHEFQVTAGAAAVVSTAPGLGQPRPHRLGEARGLHVYEASAGDLKVETYVCVDGEWGLAATRRFPRGRLRLASG